MRTYFYGSSYIKHSQLMRTDSLCVCRMDSASGLRATAWQFCVNTNNSGQFRLQGLSLQPPPCLPACPLLGTAYWQQLITCGGYVPCCRCCCCCPLSAVGDICGKFGKFRWGIRGGVGGVTALLG